MSATFDLVEEERRRFRRFLLASAGVHLLLLLTLALSPTFSSPPQLPAAITVDLLAAPGPPPASRAAPAPKAPKPAPPPPAAKPEPVPPPPPVAKPAPVPPPPVAKPAPPPPVAKPAPPPPPTAEKVLPKEAAKAPEQAKPAPAPQKPTPPQQAAARPAPPAPPKPAPPQKQASIDDVLSQLRAEAGETEPLPVAEAETPAPVPGTGGGGGSVKVSPEVMAWLKSARIHVRKSWILSPGFRLEPLATQIRVNLDASGNVVGTPVIVRKSGNPWYDESVLRAIQKASPLPAPPKAGEWDFLFQPEES